MAGAEDLGSSGPDGSSKLTLWDRVRYHRFINRAPIGTRVRGALLKPAPPGASTADADQLQTVEEYEAAVKRLNDKERTIGVVAAPIAAALALLITDALISNDAPKYLSDGAVDRLHVSVGLYQEAGLALVVLSIAMLAMAMLRKRLYLGMVMGLYGLTVFNLHYWGFGVPFIMGAAWYLVRAYRLQKGLKEATGGVGPWVPRSTTTTRGVSTSRPRPNKRYTPPTR